MNYLRFYRLQANLSQQELSTRTKISQPTLSHYENGLAIIYPHTRILALELGRVLGRHINPVNLELTITYLGTKSDHHSETKEGKDKD